MNYPEKQRHESNVMYETFIKYFELGPKRNMNDFANEIGKPFSELNKISKRFNWDERISKCESKNSNQKINTLKINKIDSNIKKLEYQIKESMSEQDLEKLEILNLMQKTINEFQKIINQFDETYLSEEPDYDVKIEKALKAFRVFNLYIKVSNRIDYEQKKLIYKE